MAILHIQIRAQRPAPDGQMVDLPPALAFVRRGPCIQVSLGLAEQFAEQLIKSGLSVPAPVSGLALIDTGAGTTCIDDATAQKLGLPAIGTVKMASASHASTQQNVYPARLEFTGTPIGFDAPRAIGAALIQQGILALIGRDVLQHFLLVYNGPSGQLTLAAD